MIACYDNELNKNWSSIKSSIFVSNFKESNVFSKNVTKKSESNIKKFENFPKHNHHWWKVCWFYSNGNFNNLKSNGLKCSPLAQTVETILSKSNSSVNSAENENRCQAIQDNE